MHMHLHAHFTDTCEATLPATACYLQSSGGIKDKLWQKEMYCYSYHLKPLNICTVANKKRYSEPTDIKGCLQRQPATHRFQVQICFGLSFLIGFREISFSGFL